MFILDPNSLKAWEKALPDFLHYYNYERPHMGLDMKNSHGSGAKLLTRIHVKYSLFSILTFYFTHRSFSVGGCFP